MVSELPLLKLNQPKMQSAVTNLTKFFGSKIRGIRQK